MSTWPSIWRYTDEMTPIPANVIMTRLLLAAGLSAVLGLEREYHQKPAGLRTNILIGIGSALFTILSLLFGQANMGSTDRIAAQILTGIGFLGAGAVLRGTHVHGLTTAATIWVNAAIGMAVGVGLTSVAVATTAVTLLVLVGLTPLEEFFRRWAHRRGVKTRSL
jgi:putative Mg2+ transporter-C (MgtC) family protein